MLAAIASAAIMLDGADCWAARRQGLASAFGARFDIIAVAKAATVPFRILAIGAMPLPLPRGGVDASALRGPLPACNPPTQAVAVTQSIALLFALAPQLPGLRSRELRVGTRPARLFTCPDIVILLSIPPNWVGRG